MKHNTTKCYVYRIQLEKLKQKTWRLVILARIVLFLVIVATYCLR